MAAAVSGGGGSGDGQTCTMMRDDELFLEVKLSLTAAIEHGSIYLAAKTDDLAALWCDQRFTHLVDELVETNFFFGSNHRLEICAWCRLRVTDSVRPHGSVEEHASISRLRPTAHPSEEGGAAVETGT